MNHLASKLTNSYNFSKLTNSYNFFRDNFLGGGASTDICPCEGESKMVIRSELKM